MVVLIAAVIIGSMLGISFLKIAKNSPEVDPDSILTNLSENSTILDKDGNKIEEIASEEYREIVDYKQIPKSLVDAFVNVEDERFWKHNGVDIPGIVKSTLDNIKAGNIVRGGSTITQQLVKNIYLSSDVQWERKIQEMYLALKVSDQISREDILEAYLNRVYLGQHAYGVQAASQIYFSKDVQDLTLAESATLAGIVKSPTNYSLFNAYYPKNIPEDAEVLGDFYVAGESLVAVLNKNAFERKNYVLQKMYENGAITESQYKEALAEDVKAAVKPGSKKQIEYSSHISKLIKEESLDIIMEKQQISREEATNLLYTGGLRIKTTIDWGVQAKLEEAYDKMEETMDAYTIEGQPFFADLRYDNEGNVIDLNDRVIYFKRANLLSDSDNLILKAHNYEFSESGDLSITTERMRFDGDTLNVASFYDINDKNNLVSYRSSAVKVPNDYIQKDDTYSFTISHEFLDNNPDFYKEFDDGDLVISNKYFTVESKGTQQPQSATVIIDQNNGHVAALVGSRGTSPDDTIDRASSFPRQPASAIKPLAVYGPALENGFTLASAIDDVPMKDHNGKVWPKNFYPGFKGLVPFRQALVESINTTSVKILGQIGVKTSMEYLKDFGLINETDGSKDNFITKEENPDSNDENLSLAIGSITRGFTVKDMASAYTALANGGVRHDETIIMSIESDKLGEIYNEENKETRVLTEETAWLITDALKDTIKLDEFKRGQNNFGIDVAAKTGTSNDQADYWIAGYTPYYTSATWVGFDNNNISLSGNSSSLRAFFESFMNPIIEDLEPKEFKMPSTIVKAKVDKLSGLLPNNYTAQDPRGSMIVEEYFAKGTVPKEVSPVNVALKVDTRNGLLATSSTPSYLTATRIFQKRIEPFNIHEFDESSLPEGLTMENLIPYDWKYEAPTRYSDLKGGGPIRETISNADGSVTVKVTDIDGTITETTTYPDGTVITRIYYTNGKVTETVKKPAAPKPSTPENTEKPTPDKPKEQEKPNEPTPGNTAPTNPSEETKPGAELIPEPKPVETPTKPEGGANNIN